MLIFEHILKSVYKSNRKVWKRQLFAVLVCMTMFIAASLGEKERKII